MIKQIGKYITVKEIKEPGRKTPIYCLSNSQNDYFLGMIKWNPGWRKFCFYPSIDTLFDNQCLLDISNFIKNITEKEKEVKE